METETDPTNPEPSNSFLEHAVKTPSQYDGLVRQLAAECLAHRKAGRAFERSRQAEGASWKGRPDAAGLWLRLRGESVTGFDMALVRSAVPRLEALEREGDCGLSLGTADSLTRPGDQWFGPISIPPPGEEANPPAGKGGA